jgi:hypothetical protein
MRYGDLDSEGNVVVEIKQIGLIVILFFEIRAQEFEELQLVAIPEALLQVTEEFVDGEGLLG